MGIVNDSFGNCRIIEKVHSGMVSDLYKAYDPNRNEIVALKILREEFANHPELIERFKREAKVAKNLDHPNIIKIYDIGCEQHFYYFSMKFINGPSLRKLLDEEPILPVEKAFMITKTVCLGLHFAHCAQVVHRDIKPSNIMIDENGNIIILDFGIAKVRNLARLTRPGFLIGTPEYMSPEQIRGGLIDGRSDLYSLGILLFELLTGTVPFKGNDFIEVAEKIVNAHPPRPSELNKDLTRDIDQLILKAIAKDRMERFSSGIEMANAINRILGLPEESKEYQEKLFLSTASETRGQQKREGVRITPQTLMLRKVLGEKKEFWLPSVIALSLLIIFLIGYRYPFLLPVFLILVGGVVFIWAFNLIIKKPPKRYKIARFLLYDEGKFIQEFIMKEKRVAIGRDQPEGIELFKETISRSHAEVINENGFYIIYDLHSTNGTFVNGKRIQQRILRDGDQIDIGGVTLIFRGEG